MLNDSVEYTKMAEAEEKLWWYHALHELTLDAIQKKYSEKKDITIVDAGCGTAGLLIFLQKNGYNNLHGFDLSEDAVNWCKSRGFNVYKNSLLNIAEIFPSNFADVITSNDTLYFLEEEEQKVFIRKCFQILRPGGLLILNLPALKSFRGIHDIAVGINKRFSKQNIPVIFSSIEFDIINKMYWPFLLSPIIFWTRLMQRIKIRLFPDYEVRSDVELPGKILNSILHAIVSLENKWLPVKPFGSSLFIVANKYNKNNS